MIYERRGWKREVKTRLHLVPLPCPNALSPFDLEPLFSPLLEHDIGKK